MQYCLSLNQEVSLHVWGWHTEKHIVAINTQGFGKVWTDFLPLLCSGRCFAPLKQGQAFSLIPSIQKPACLWWSCTAVSVTSYKWKSSFLGSKRQKREDLGLLPYALFMKANMTENMATVEQRAMMSHFVRCCPCCSLLTLNNNGCGLFSAVQHMRYFFTLYGLFLSFSTICPEG